MIVSANGVDFDEQKFEQVKLSDSRTAEQSARNVWCIIMWSYYWCGLLLLGIFPDGKFGLFLLWYKHKTCQEHLK